MLNKANFTITESYIYLLHHLHPPKKASDMEEIHHCPLFEKKDAKGIQYEQLHIKRNKKIYHALDTELESAPKAVYCHLNNEYKVKLFKDADHPIITGLVDPENTRWADQDKYALMLDYLTD